MNTTLISALIAFVGVLTSVIISYLSNKRVLKTELEKIEVNIEQNYASKLVEKRLEFYPIVYEPLSRMSKNIRRIIFEKQGEKILLKEIIEFQKTYDDMNSQYGVVFSSITSEKSKNLRVLLSNIILHFKKTNVDIEMTEATLTDLKNSIGELEFAMKQDLGIYIVEFKDPKRKLQLEKYEDVVIQRILQKS